MHLVRVKPTASALLETQFQRLSFHRLKKRLTAQVKSAQALAPLGAPGFSIMCTPTAGEDVAVEKVQAVTGPFQVPH